MNFNDNSAIPKQTCGYVPIGSCPCRKKFTAYTSMGKLQVNRVQAWSNAYLLLF
jgi:hypothetical protein